LRPSHLIQPIDPVSVDTAVSQDESAIVFFRATSFGGAVQAPVLEVNEDGSLKFVTIVSAGAKLLHKTTPGKHLYLIDGEFGYFLEADLEGGKTYYSYITPKFGWWRARFLFAPVRNPDDATFRKDFAWCEWYANKPEGQQWFVKAKGNLEKRYSDIIEEYADSPAEDKTFMLPEYGRTMPVK
jgi:hypothetical protein